jgi:hypothetical protein
VAEAPDGGRQRFHQGDEEDRKAMSALVHAPREVRQDEAAFDKIADAGGTLHDTFLAFAPQESVGVVSMSDSIAELGAFVRAADDWESVYRFRETRVVA